MRKLTLIALLLAAPGLLACEADEETQVVVTVDAESGIRARAASASLVVHGDPNGVPREVFNNQAMPHTEPFPYVIALTPQKGDAASTYSVEVSARDGAGGLLAVARLVSGYVDGRTLYINLQLEDSCVGIPCGAGSTCHLGSCIDARVAAAGFGDSRASAPYLFDLSPRIDGGSPDASTGDATVQPTPDAGHDTGVQPTPDAGDDSGPAPRRCEPRGSWTIQQAERTGGTCQIGTASFTGTFQGELTEFVAPIDETCETEITELSDDGCTFSFDQICEFADTGNTSEEFGTLTMTSASAFSGTTMVYLEDELGNLLCSSTIDLAGSPTASAAPAN